MAWGLVLAGGGARGSYHVGVWKALLEMGIEVSAITGASIGAINGALFVQGDFRQALDLWEHIDIEDIVSLPEEMEGTDNLFKVKNLAKLMREFYKNSGLDMSPLEELLKETVCEKEIRSSPIDYGLATFSRTKHEEITLFKEDIPEGQLVSYLMASASLPGFKAKVIGQEKFMDGAVANNMPVNMLLDRGMKDIITVDVKGVGIVRNENTYGRNIVPICCAQAFVGTMEFNSQNLHKNIQNGYYDACKAFGRYAGTHYSFNIQDYYEARSVFSEQILNGMEQAGQCLGLSPFRVWTVREMIGELLRRYGQLQVETIGMNLLDQIGKAAIQEDFLVCALVDLLESRQVLNNKLVSTVLGSSVEAANAILYLKKRNCEEKHQ
jgi:NTE family protein